MRRTSSLALVLTPSLGLLALLGPLAGLLACGRGSAVRVGERVVAGVVTHEVVKKLDEKDREDRRREREQARRESRRHRPRQRAQEAEPQPQDPQSTP